MLRGYYTIENITRSTEGKITLAVYCELTVPAEKSLTGSAFLDIEVHVAHKSHTL